MSSSSPAQTGPLQAKFKDLHQSSHGVAWDELWQEGHTTWDRGSPHPALEDVLERSQDLIGDCWIVDANGEKRRKRALVPGCGRGYDVLLLSSFGYDAFGLDVSDTALAAARELERNREQHEVYQAKSKGNGLGKVTWLVGDFFTNDFLKDVEGDGTFDLIWDYTVSDFNQDHPLTTFTLMDVSDELLASEGCLICGEWPTYKAPKDGGPPWALPSTIYLTHLPRPGIEIAYDDQSNIIPDKLASEETHGLYRKAHWTPERTHPNGIIDGVNTDKIGVWKHKIG